MVLKEDILKRLRSAFDMNIYEVRIWTALLSRGMATAGELSDIGNVPRSRSYDVLETLEKKGFVMMKLGKPIRYLAVEPEEILKRLKDGIKVSAENRVKSLEKIRGEDVFRELDILYKQGINKVDPYSLSGAVKGRDNVYSQIRGMLERAEKSVTIATTAEGILRKSRRFKSLLIKLSEDGVRIRIAVPSHATVPPELKAVAKIKPIDKLNTRFVLVDDKEVLFMVADDKDTHETIDTAVWVNTPFFAKAFSTMFNNTWNSAE